MLYPIIRRQRRPLLPPEEILVAPVAAPAVAAPIEQSKEIEVAAPDVPVSSAEPIVETASDDGALGERRPTIVVAEVVAPDLNLVADEQPAVKGKRAKVSQNRKTEAE
ncbi:MAG: hypothetical protein ACK4UN_05610 [Limisphaerales bacterium]